VIEWLEIRAILRRLIGRRTLWGDGIHDDYPALTCSREKVRRSDGTRPGRGLPNGDFMTTKPIHNVKDVWWWNP
jgi:hypothetical protein